MPQSSPVHNIILKLVPTSIQYHPSFKNFFPAQTLLRKRHLIIYKQSSGKQMNLQGYFVFYLVFQMDSSCAGLEYIIFSRVVQRLIFFIQIFSNVIDHAIKRKTYVVPNYLLTFSLLLLYISPMLTCTNFSG